MLLCEAAGFDVVFVETVGVGQSETVVAEMVDTVVLLLLPGAGDELQGIKRGILERVDLVAVNKADGERQAAARKAKTWYLSALKYLRTGSHWTPPVLTLSGLEGDGIDRLWDAIGEHCRVLRDCGELDAKRQEQQRRWMWSLLEDELLDAFRRRPSVAELLPELEARVTAGELPPGLAARRLLKAFGVGKS
jgi:LAO/AO transport system kinase